MKPTVLLALPLAALLLISCNQTRTKDESAQLQEIAVDDGHTYEYGIPVDMYSMEEGTIAKGDFFASLLGRYGVSNQKAVQLADISKDVFDVRGLHVGRDYHAYFDTLGNLAYLVYEATDRKMVVFSTLDSLGAAVIEKDIARNVRYTEVEIQNSLWADIQNAGASPLLALKLSEIYAWTINFFGLQKGDRLIPVISLVIYYSPDAWDGPRTLHEMLNWEDGRNRFKAYVPDYALNLIEPVGILQEEFSWLTTPLKQVLEYIKYSNNHEDLLRIVEQDTAFKKMNRQTVRLLNQVAGAHISYSEQEETMDMNKAPPDKAARSWEFPGFGLLRLH